MRTKTALDTALLSAGFGQQSVWIKVEVDQTGSGDWVDLSNWNGLDYVRAVRYRESIDAPAWSATIELHERLNDAPHLSISPGMSSSIPNLDGVLCALNNSVVISTATVPMGAGRPSTFVEVFRGYIQSYSLSNGVLTLECPDQTGRLMEFFIERESVYGSKTPATATAADIEEVIQNLIDDHYNTNTDIGGTASSSRSDPLASRTTDGDPVQLYSYNGTSTTPFNLSTGAAVREYPQPKQLLWEAIAANVAKLQWQCRYRWHEGSGVNAFVLVLEDPDRTKSTADFTVDPKLSQAKITSFGLSRDYIRNVVRGSFALGGSVKRTSEQSSVDSRNKYGRLFMEFNVGSGSQIDTAAEAQDMTTNALDDLKEPTASVQLSMPYSWWVQLNDLVAIEADDIHFDSQLKLAVLSRENIITQGAAGVTTLVCRGLPKSSSEKYTQNISLFNPYKRAPNSTSGAKSGGGRFENPTGSVMENE